MGLCRLQGHSSPCALSGFAPLFDAGRPMLSAWELRLERNLCVEQNYDYMNPRPVIRLTLLRGSHPFSRPSQGIPILFQGFLKGSLS